MELQFLDGIEEKNNARTDLFGGNNLGELGKLLKKKSGGGSPKKGIFKRSPEKKAAAKEKRKAIGKKVLKVVNKLNKLNPATVLLRAGILASMKLNVMKVAEKIKWGYVTPEFAQSKGMDMSKYDKVKGVLARTEQIFYAAGGKQENLKKAILTGHGNRNHEVAGFDGFNEDTPLSQLLGAIYNDEFVSGMEGFEGFDGTEGLGEPATAASVAAASTAMGTLAALLKAIGDLFPNKGKEKGGKEKKGLLKKKKGDSSEEPAAEEPSDNSEPAPEEPSAEEQAPVENEPAAEEPAANSEETPSEPEMEVTPSEDVPNEPSEGEEGTSGILSGPGVEGFKAWLKRNKKPLIIGAAIIGTVAIGIGLINHFSKKEEEEEQTESRPMPNGYAINGTGKKRGRKRKSEHQELGVIELM